MAYIIDRSPHVVILLSRTHVSHTQILRGILRHSQRNRPWTMDVRMGREGEPTAFDAASWRFDGIVANRLPPDMVRLARRHRTPMVLLNDIGPGMSPVARIDCDNESVAKMAVSHFLERGFENFAYIGGQGRQPWSVARGEAFSAELARRGFGCSKYDGAGSGSISDSGEDPELGAWLIRLRKPVAIFVAYDFRALGVLGTCARAGIAVPEEVAVLGVDNDDVLCETMTPTLSSIAMTTEEAGYRAAGALDAAMAGRQHVGGQRILYAAKAVVARRSTAHDSAGDALVRRCREIIEANISEHFGVADLARGLNVSRRTLETRFRAATGRSPGEEIIAQRLGRAKALLAQTSLSQARIARACGFTDASHMNVVFRRRLGRVPSAFR